MSLGLVVAGCSSDSDDQSEAATSGAATNPDSAEADAAGADESIGDGDGGGAAAPPASVDLGDTYIFNSQQTMHQDVELSADEIAAGLAVIEQKVADDAERAGNSFTGHCWILVDGDGITAQVMSCGPIEHGDEVYQWRAIPFAAEREGDTYVIAHAPMLEGHVGARPGSTFVRPDRVAAPGDAIVDGMIRPDSATPDAPEATPCQASGSYEDEDGLLVLDEMSGVEVIIETQVPGIVEGDGPVSVTYHYAVIGWDEESQRGLRISFTMAGLPGEEELTHEVRVFAHYEGLDAARLDARGGQFYNLSPAFREASTWGIDVATGGTSVVEFAPPEVGYTPRCPGLAWRSRWIAPECRARVTR